MATVSERNAALELSAALKSLDQAQAVIDAGDWWDGPPFYMEQDRDRAADRVAAAVRELCGIEVDDE